MAERQRSELHLSQRASMSVKTITNMPACLFNERDSQTLQMLAIITHGGRQVKHGRSMTSAARIHLTFQVALSSREDSGSKGQKN
ncbi:hypothetical protein AVEN_263117-1 [Araneus ventricosus]|uniref:Uncharacterized protein n=1 Tax=Araneus ventricosus TaxID=182803 RepID=A0A4Y2JD88_ARAVE|nr:hypothetical protein AVEN_263117-1 [Araneus ventricosus]